MTFEPNAARQLGLVSCEVPGATPNAPASGLIAYRRPSLPGLIQAMSSPMVVTFQPFNAFGGISIARLVLPQALGNAAAMYCFSPSGGWIPRISMCSASQPCSRAMMDAMRNAKHFLPSSAFPPYPLPNDQIDFSSGKWTIHFSFLLLGHGTSFCPAASGMPTECTHGTKNPSVPSTLSASRPMRVMMRMLATTYGESVNSTPTCEMCEPSGPMLNG